MSAVKSLASGPLKDKLIELIRLKGPLTVADYMKIVLTNPESGFYMNNDVFGVKGHFTTSPEISQMFGEVLGAWIFQEWTRFNCPIPLRLVEFGPGRGTLMADITRTLGKLGSKNDDLDIRLIEISSQLIEVQQRTLSKISDRIKWHTHLAAMDEDQNGFTAFLAHEFLDALPIYKFVRDPKTKSWRELLIDYDEDRNLRFAVARRPSLATRLMIPKDFQGDHLEVCPEAAITLEKVSQRINSSGKGCMLICDYGFEQLDDSNRDIMKFRSDRDTFRAFKDHESWPPLKDPGEADLTADVDFGYLKKHLIDKALIFGSVDQKTFLTKCGLPERLAKLTDNAQGSIKDDLTSGAHMILEAMGLRYRFLSLFPKQSSDLFKDDPPAGFN